MSERKYRQRGYQDDDRGREKPRTSQGPRVREERIGPRTPNMPGFREVVRCAQCGHLIGQSDAHCGRCGADLHSCAQCAYFDTSARFECSQSVPARVTPKSAHNECTLFELRVAVERETGSSSSTSRSSGAAGPTDARKAFDDLFK